jgi:lipopolysaccharide biosynthesis regulator YciM
LRAALLAVLAGEEDRAEELIARAARADSSAIDAYLALGRLYRSRDEVGRAIRIHQNLLLRGDLEKAERITALAELARDFERGGFVRRAIACYEEVLTYDARHVATLDALLELLSEARDYPRAIEVSRRLARAKGERAPHTEASLWVRMAEVAHAEGRPEAARKAVKRALRKNADSCQALLLLGQLESERNRGKAALTAWRKAAQVGSPGAAAVYPRLESAYASLDRGQEYPAFLRELLQQRPDDTTLRLVLARALATRGDVEPAVAELRRLLDGEPRSIQARVALGRLLLSEHRNADAVKEYSELLEVLEPGGDSEAVEEPA